MSSYHLEFIYLGKENLKMRTRKTTLIFANVLICAAFICCGADSARAISVDIADVHVSPAEPTPIDVITIFASGGLAHLDTPFDHSELSIVEQSVQLDLFFGVGYLHAVGDWSHSEEIGTLPAGTYTLMVRTLEPIFGLNHTYTISFTVVPELVEAEVDVRPKTLNLKSKGKWLNCHIYLPEDYNVADVNSYSISLMFPEDEIYADWLWFNEEQNVLMAKFNRSYVQEVLADSEDVLETGQAELTITGQLLDGTIFEGTDTIRVIDGGYLNGQVVNSNSKIENGIEYYIQTNKSVYILGENVEMLYRVTNLGDEDVTFWFPRRPVWNFWVEKGQENIWRAVNAWQYIITEFTLTPGESREFPDIGPSYIWNMRDSENNLVNVGKYNVIGGLYAGSEAHDYTKVAVPIRIIPNK
jgi:hypothetical protein